MKRFSLVAISLILAGFPPWLRPIEVLRRCRRSGTLANARYVYIASYDGDQFNPNLLSKIATRSAPCRTPFSSGQADDRVPALRGRRHHPRDEPAFRRSDGVYDGTRNRSAIFSGASWDATVSSTVKLRWSPI